MKPRLRPLLLWTLPSSRTRVQKDVGPIEPGPCLANQRGHENPLLARSTITTLASCCLIERRFLVGLKAAWQREPSALVPVDQGQLDCL
jgi:hypothetical protein